MLQKGIAIVIDSHLARLSLYTYQHELMLSVYVLVK